MGVNMDLGGESMSPHQSFARIPLQVGSELRIHKTGEISVSNPTVETAPSQDAADAILDYRFDPQSGEHILRLIKPTAPHIEMRRRR